jgi:CRP-like cAMP-binding protein
MKIIRNFIRQFSPAISEIELDFFIEKWQSKSLKKGQFLLQKGQFCRELILIEKGCFKIFYQLEDRQINAQFAFEGMIVSEIHSFIKQKPSQYSIQALENSTVWMIKYEDLQMLYQQFNAIQHFGLKLTENILAECIERLTSFQFEEAQNRYERICHDHNFMNRVPLKDLASFLGITPNSLSRLRRLTI